MDSNLSGFGRQSGPSAPAKSVVFGQAIPPSSSSSFPVVVQRTISQSPPFINPNDESAMPSQQFGARAADIPRGLDNGQTAVRKDYDSQTVPKSSFVSVHIASHNSGTSATAKIARFQDLKRSRSPPFLPTAEELPRNSITITRPASTSPLVDDNKKLRENPSYQDQSRVSPHLRSYDTEGSMGQLANLQAPKRTKSPLVSSANGVSWDNPQLISNDSKRSNIYLGATDSQSPLRSGISTNNTVTSIRSTTSPVSKRTRFPTSLSTNEGYQGNSSSNQYDDAEREMQAKAKRLARFRVELSENVDISPDAADHRESNSKQEHFTVERRKLLGERAAESSRDYNDSGTLDYEGPATSSIIIGLCSDMCPESERAERERKGDLDQYERVDGDRNQSSKYLAVKKYNRTAEREANLIRPMPILQKTVGYLLNLLDQPYNERFLGLYNFLWDRMRAVRMDLRMQHIFNQGAITMLEQMIRLHIIAMHELCECIKGEGFSEGFDAHLNIEQMNKTSVELFQMYDDHRKKGINVPTETEFRGYYALLKLDKHPGYKVEPAELSLDLAKMTPEMRQMPEVLFARDVARACRTGNFIAFFRLARKASYLQACLMHAHFAKLRTQALASLHAGLLNNQGLPVSHVGRWLAMEEEDIESLLEYHGFSIKEFEEPYLVKDGPFLNNDKDFPTKCSKLVDRKRSGSIVEDILASNQAISLPTRATKPIQPGQIHKHHAKTTVKRKTSICLDAETMPHTAVSSQQNMITPEQPQSETSMVYQPSNNGAHKVPNPFISPLFFSVPHSSPKSQPAKLVMEEKENSDTLFRMTPEKKLPEVVVEEKGNKVTPEIKIGTVVMEEKRNNDALFRLTPEKKIVSGTEGVATHVVSKSPQLGRSPSSKKYGYSVEKVVPQSVAIDNQEDDNQSDTLKENENDEVMESENDESREKETGKAVADHLEEEIALAKLKLVIRLWRRRTLRLKGLREQRQLAANAALNWLSAGPPIRRNEDKLSSIGGFDIDNVMRERSEKYEHSWSQLNVSDVIASILCSRNPDVRCLCWKIILCTQDSLTGNKQMKKSKDSQLAAESWLLSKLMPPKKDDCDDSLLVSSSGLSIWKKWVPNKSDADLTCCFSVVKQTDFELLSDTLSGASAIVFLISGSTPLNLQKVQLHNFLYSVPAGAQLPLLILSDSCCEETLDPFSYIVHQLGLHDVDKSRVNSFSVKFLAGDRESHSDGFFSDEQLREGLQWLAKESPLQPAVDSVKTRELVFTYLNRVLKGLDKLTDYEVGPNHCISAFNEAIDQSLGAITTAVSANPICWPCPEITLLEDTEIANHCLPRSGWSTSASIEPLITALRDLKLPAFPDEISWLHNRGSLGKEIENLRFQLENCLVSYLTQTCQMMESQLATKEASIMLQRSTRLELHNSSYLIIPNWVMIFRRIFNWRLMSLPNGKSSTAYVLKEHLISSPPDDSDELGLQIQVSSSPYSMTRLSFDEIMEVSCSPFKTQAALSQPQVYYLPGVESNANNIVRDARNSSQNGMQSVAEDFSYITRKFSDKAGEIMVSRQVTKEANNLSELLEQCILMQNQNGKKLSMYF